MSDRDCVAFLQWALPRLGMRWRGFRKPRRQVCRRLRGRYQTLGLPDLTAYRAYLEAHEEEWAVLDPLCRVTISRFYRNRRVFEGLTEVVLPALARAGVAAGRQRLRVWSAGCASGEEAHTVSLVWRLGGLAEAFPGLELDVLGTDIDPVVLGRATEATYPAGSLRELPAGWRGAGFEACDDGYVVRPEVRRGVRFERRDVRDVAPPGLFDLIFCRFVAFTYHDEAGQLAVARSLRSVLVDGGALVLGTQEAPPDEVGFAPWLRGVWRAQAGAGTGSTAGSSTSSSSS